MAKGKKGGKSSHFRAAKNVPDRASLSVSLPISDSTLPPLMNSSGVMYPLTTVNLSQFDRAVQVAQAYQHYRIKKLTLHFKPMFDTFSAANPGGGVPNLYYMIDKSGALPLDPTLTLLQSAGAKPHRFDDKVIPVSWRPAVTMGARETQAVDGDVNANYKISPWLNTNNNVATPGFWNPSMVNHLGIYYIVEQTMAAPALYYRIDLTAEFEFKKPIWTLQGDAAVEPSVTRIPLIGGKEIVGAKLLRQETTAT